MSGNGWGSGYYWALAGSLVCCFCECDLKQAFFVFGFLLYCYKFLPLAHFSTLLRRSFHPLVVSLERKRQNNRQQFFWIVVFQILPKVRMYDHLFAIFFIMDPSSYYSHLWQARYCSQFWTWWVSNCNIWHVSNCPSFLTSYFQSFSFSPSLSKAKTFHYFHFPTCSPS